MLRSSAAGLPLSSVHPVSGTKAGSRQLPVSGLSLVQQAHGIRHIPLFDRCMLS
jgi:hypothetical protein